VGFSASNTEKDCLQNEIKSSFFPELFISFAAWDKCKPFASFMLTFVNQVFLNPLS
jgi:hypothetical protein